MTSPSNLGGLSAKELGKRVWADIGRDDVFGRAAQLAYYFFLALFPLVLFLLSIIALVSGRGSSLESSLMSYISRVAPSDASQLIKSTVAQTFEASGGLKAVFAIVGALWAASQGVSALMDTLNTAYEAKETRPWWKQRGLALWITIAASVLIAVGLALLTLGQTVAASLASGGGLGAAGKWVWYVAQWPVIIFLLLVAFGIVYY
jgi:membrane protein